MCTAAVWAVLAQCSDAEFADALQFLEELVTAAAPDLSATEAKERYLSLSGTSLPYSRLTLGCIVCGSSQLRGVFAALQEELGWSRQQAAEGLLRASVQHDSLYRQFPARSDSLLAATAEQITAFSGLLR